MGCKTAALNQTGKQIMAQHQDNNVGGFVKAQKPVRLNQARSTKNTHNRRAGFNAKRNQSGYTMIELIQVAGLTVGFACVCWILFVMYHVIRVLMQG
jgi:hypothetical protein